MTLPTENAPSDRMPGRADAVPPACILCGSCNREIMQSCGRWTIYRCTGCGLGVLDPQPRKEELSALYDREYFASQYDTGVEPDSPEFNRWLDLLEHRVRFFRRLKRRGRLLDIGCGNGYFLALCRKRGYEVRGTDVSAWAAGYASSKLGIEVTVAETEDLAFPPESFDIVTMWHTLEHMRKPDELLSNISRWLKRDGILVIEVPNYAGTDARHDGEGWIGWQVPFHLYHFTPDALAKLLEKKGFRIVKFKDFHSESVKERLRRYPVIGWFSRLVARFFSGHSVAVVAQKMQ